jgi:hypothetical protein
MVMAQLIPQSSSAPNPNNVPASGQKPAVHIFPQQGTGTALRGIPAEKLQKLFRHSNPTQTHPSLQPWQYKHFVFGDPGAYNNEARLRDAGILPEELLAAGLALQADQHGRYSDIPKLDPVGAAARRESYLVQHFRVPIDARVSPKNNPSGICPRWVPAGITSAMMLAWHASLQTMVMNAQPGTLIVCPPIVTGDGAGGVVPGAPGVGTVPQAPRPKGCPEFLAFYTELQRFDTGIAGVLKHLKSGEDQGFLGPLTSAFEAWLTLKPEDLAKVQDAHFDPTLIREGVEVTIDPTSKSMPFAKAMAKASKLDNPPPTFKVVAIANGRCTLHGEGMSKDFPVALADVKRVILRAAPPPPVVPVTWNPQVGDRALFGETGVFITDIVGELCTVLTDDGDEMEGILLADLKPAA